MNRRVASLALALAALIPACRDETPGDAQVAATPAAPPPLIVDQSARKKKVAVLWPAKDAAGLVERSLEIFDTSDAADQARQVIGALLGAPPDEGVVAPLPPGTTLTSFFLDERGTAYVGLSDEAVSKAPGGSAWELLAVHSIVGSATRAVPRIRRVQILVGGKEIETLAGHLDLRGPVTFDASLVAAIPPNP